MKVFNQRQEVLFHSSLVLGSTVQWCLLLGEACARAEGGEGWHLVLGATLLAAISWGALPCASLVTLAQRLKHVWQPALFEEGCP